MAFKLISGAFTDGAAIPRLHTCEGADLSPPLEWSGVPASALSFALIMDDPDAPGGTWNHWLLYDIPAEWHTLPQGFQLSKPSVSGANDFGKIGYGGPCPPKGRGAHRYFFRLYALDAHTLGLAPGVKRGELDRALKGHVLGEARYMGKFERQ